VMLLRAQGRKEEPDTVEALGSSKGVTPISLHFFLLRLLCRNFVPCLTVC